ncbi:hypothetical protein TW95_gp1696 [Pandoravirus inopinatum]|uniref:Uncharacterized protein n=1 Tax=Pandoravirus inopinatum TaxID=1605721 RepID=A0A0B5J8Z0_9VIRU|nr:hypothetical protein TW95_gp1696 [Pandoravirus inopinatum]AJF98430.1 hypothetical protein [Pandoravirus inopinatum]
MKSEHYKKKEKPAVRARDVSQCRWLPPTDGHAGQTAEQKKHKSAGALRLGRSCCPFCLFFVVGGAIFCSSLCGCAVPGAGFWLALFFCPALIVPSPFCRASASPWSGRRGKLLGDARAPESTIPSSWRPTRQRDAPTGCPCTWPQQRASRKKHTYTQGTGAHNGQKGEKRDTTTTTTTITTTTRPTTMATGRPRRLDLGRRRLMRPALPYGVDAQGHVAHVRGRHAGASAPLPRRNGGHHHHHHGRHQASGMPHRGRRPRGLL